MLKAIEQQNKRLREIAHIQSHSMRSGVATILGLAPLLDIQKETDAETKQILEGIVQSSLHLDKVIKQVNKPTVEE